MKTFKNLFSITAIVALLGTMLSPAVNYTSASFSSELEGAYGFAADNGITSASSIDNANMYGSLTRIAMAKMMANFSMDVLGNTPDTSMDCNFPDVSDALDAQYDNGVTNACQLGLMGVGIDNFNPYGLVNRAQFGTVLSRALYGDMYNGANPYYADHLAALKDAGIMNNISNPMMLEVRGYVMLMMQRASDDADATNDGCSAEELLACITADDYDSCIAECSGDTTPPDDIVYNGDLSVKVSSSTPNGVDLPKGSEGVDVAKFELRASNDDVEVNSIVLKRGELGRSAVVKAAVFSDSMGRISKAKSFNSSTDEVTLNFSPALIVKEGSTETLSIKVNTTSTPADLGKFNVELLSVGAKVDSVDLNNVVSDTFEVVNTAAKEIQIDTDGTTTNPKLGEDKAEVLKFKIKNVSSNNEDVTLKEITLKEGESIDQETELENIRLYHDGNLISIVDSMSSKYVTFSLDDDLLIKDGQTEKFVVKADVIGGANNKIDFYLDNDLDVTATANKFGFVKVTSTLAITTNTLTVQAGEVTLIAEDATNTDIKKNKDDVVFGTITINTNAGKDLELQQFTVNLEDTSATYNMSDVLENVELYDATNGAIYDLIATAGAANAEDFADTDLSIAIPDSGKLELVIRADTKDTTIDGAKFVAKVDVANDVKIVELADDTAVSDKVPSSISFKTVNGVASNLSINKLTMSSTKSAVIGSNDIDVLSFEVKSTNDASDLTVKELKVKGVVVDNADSAGSNTGTDTLADNTRVNTVYLYHGDTLLDSISASQLSAGVATFNGFNVDVSKNTAENFMVKTDIIDDVNQKADDLNFQLVGYDVEDDQSDNVYITADTNANGSLLDAGETPISSDRTVTIKGAGTLAAIADNTDTETDKDKNVLGGTTSDFVASYEFTSTNEGILIKDLKVDQTNAGVNLQDAVNEVILYANDKTTEIARESVSSDTVTFDNINYTINEGSDNIYVKVITNRIGKDEAGTQTDDLALKLTVTDAEGENSNKTIATLPIATSSSNKFSVVPVKISNIAFVNSYGGETVTNNLTNGENVVGIVAVTTEDTTNTNSTNDSSLKTELESMKVSINTDLLEFDATPDAGDVSALTVEKINGTVTAKTVAQVSGATMADAYDLNGGINLFKGVDLGADEDLDNGTTAYYVVKATVSGLSATANKYIQLKLADLDTSATATVEYSSDNVPDPSAADEGTDDITSLRIGVTSINADSISSSY